MADLAAEFRATIGQVDAACFIAYADNTPIVFAECRLRHDYVEGTDTSPVGYLEGIFVLEEYRNEGYAALLLTQCEQWAGDNGCVEFAGDCELYNADSLAFHLAVGFEETNRIIFSKNL